MALEPSRHSSPPAQPSLGGPSRLGIFLLLLLAGQGCVSTQPDKRNEFLLAFERGKEAGPDFDLAIAEYTEAIHLNSKDAVVYDRRGMACEHKADYGKALADYQEAVRLKPDYADGYNNLAWLLAVCPDPRFRNGAIAVKYAKKGCELTKWKNPAILDTLGAADAEVGDFDDAVKWEKQYMASNPSNPTWDKGACQRLSLYEQKKPYHEEKP